MTPQQIVDALESMGWQAEIVQQQDVPDLVAVNEDGLMKCVDGRPSDHPGMRGPKTLGGVYAIASVRGVRDLAGLQDIVREVHDAGYVPSVHGDDHAHPAPMGCGFFKLWSQGALEAIGTPDYSSLEGKAAVIEAGGVYEELAGAHTESVVMINLVSGTTLEPVPDQRFVVDAWITADFDLDVPTYLTLAAKTVELLNGPRIARIIVP